jgi:peptidoglycan/LPS O-acetylase OafA/YrhL
MFRRVVIRLWFFCLLRFSLLYQLHFSTLLLVVIGQWYFLSLNGYFFVYQNNDLHHFLLQLGFASNWGPDWGYSFNGPIWSVSIEVLLYAIFFCTASLRLTRPWHLCLFAFAGYCLMRTALHHQLGRGMMSFFVGGIAFYGFMWLQQRRGGALHLRLLLAGSGLLWILLPLNQQFGFIPSQLGALTSHLPEFAGKVLVIGLLPLSYPFELLLFPLTIVTLACWETQRGTLGRRARFLGQISYSSYLLHFPLQLLFVILASAFAIPRATFLAPASLFLFFVALIALSLASFHWFELPCQRLVRNWLLSHRAKERAVKTSLS